MQTKLFSYWKNTEKCLKMPNKSGGHICTKITMPNKVKADIFGNYCLHVLQISEKYSKNPKIHMITSMQL
jgi:hypothetical protein